MSKELKRYFTAYHFWWVIGALYPASALIFFAVYTIMGKDVSILGFLVFTAMLLMLLLPLYLAKRFFDKLEQEGLATQLDADFSSARPMRKNKVRFGQKWIFMKGKTKLLRYEEIKQIYQYIHKQNFVEDERKLKYVDTKGKTRTMCSLELKGKSDEELREMVKLILDKNPKVIVGYRR